MSAAKRGFAAMNPEKQKEIASKGGRKAHAIGKAHRFTSEQARAAGEKGGKIVSQDREHMSRIGKLGGSLLAKQRGKEYMSAIGRLGGAANGKST